MNEQWTDEHEILCKEWLKLSENAISNHTKLARKHRLFHYVFGLPTIIIPIISTTLLIYINNNTVLSTVSFLITGISSTIDKFFDFNGEFNRHKEYIGRYNDVITDIKFELAIARQFRGSPDQILTKLQQKIDYNLANGPF